MNEPMIDNIARAVLYEGYILYPYRRSTKNHQRWTFGGVFPRDYTRAAGDTEPHAVQTQCLLRGGPDTRVALRVRFLHPSGRSVRTASGTPVDHLDVAGRRYESWQEATERSVALDDVELSEAARTLPFQFGGDQSVEPIHDEAGNLAGHLVRTRALIQGAIEISAQPVSARTFLLTVRVTNHTPLPQPTAMTREQAVLHSMASTHVALGAVAGQFVSLIDPPPDLKDVARQCRNVGLWPVLVGEPGSTDCVLAAPIILYDYPQIAPESPGDLFDGTEIDEILSLRILTLTDDEKRAAADLDARGAAMLRRTESLAREQLARLHGAMRPPRWVEAVHVGHAELRIGDRVRLAPRGGADAFDVILRGKTATITAIEQDYESRLHLAVTVDDDPGADIGAAGKIAHRFYFRPDEVQPLVAAQEAPTP
jgi:hypothetical protein